RTDANLLNYHLAMSHSILEDNIIFIALGVSVWWILGVRLAVAWIVVWGKRIILKWKLGNSNLSLKNVW
ncbi:MAG TPA: nucleoside recognition protein, partial [Porphyromonadaceae bacterium]|nr:nucleoside recognition protein [Porphyromonadaceae bacterium]